MTEYPNIILLGLGHRARNGKDTVANYLKEKLENVEIIHWADGVYEECTNAGSKFPLIIKEFTTSAKTYYTVLANKDTGERFAISDKADPYLHKIFTDRDITEYWNMTDKDAEILQFWGTNYRRKFCDSLYWVNLTINKAKQIAETLNNGYILVPDTRFKNEVDALRLNSGYYIKVVRTREDGSQYIADDRDPNHPSEAELEGYPADVTLTAIDVPALKDQVDEFYHGFLDPIKMAAAFAEIGIK